MNVGKPNLLASAPAGAVMTEGRLHEILASETVAYPGTISAIYNVVYLNKPVLLKVFSGTRTRHTRDFCRWAYGRETLTPKHVSEIADQLGASVTRLLDYGLRVTPPLEVWDVADPFAERGSVARALAVTFERHDAMTVREHAFALLPQSEEVLALFEKHLAHVLCAVNAAIRLQAVADYSLGYGFDPKPRNFLLDGGFVYVDSFPVLYPKIMAAYANRAPSKAFCKRFDIRYYIYDLLMRYFRICPDLYDELRDAAFQQIARCVQQPQDYIYFVDEAIHAYREKWGHLLPDPK